MQAGYPGLCGGGVTVLLLYHTAQNTISINSKQKPQYKLKGISQNEFVSKSHLVVTTVPEHHSTGRAGAVQGGAVAAEGKAVGSLSGVWMAPPGHCVCVC